MSLTLLKTAISALSFRCSDPDPLDYQHCQLVQKNCCYFFRKLQQKQMKEKDQRVKMMNEILQGIKVQLHTVFKTDCTLLIDCTLHTFDSAHERLWEGWMFKKVSEILNPKSKFFSESRTFVCLVFVSRHKRSLKSYLYGNKTVKEGLKSIQCT